MEQSEKKFRKELQICLICNCGLLISHGSSTVLIDAPNAPHRKFRVMDEDSLTRFQNAQEEFSDLRGLVFTHTHPDHCDVSIAREFLRKHPRCTSFIPSYDVPDSGKIFVGDIQIEYGYLPHMNVPEGMTKHYVFLISCEGKTIYITADASGDPRLHEEFLRGRNIDTALWNPYYLDIPEMRAWIASLGIPYNYIYHIPDDVADESGVRRKAERLVAQYGKDLRNCMLLHQYPSKILIP